MQIAADTNVLLDLADAVEDVLDALAVISERLPNADHIVPPSVMDELAYLADFGQTAGVRISATKAFQHLRIAPRFRPLLELPFAPERVNALADEIRAHQLLPANEVHDALILAETALLGCRILLTSDAHLREIDHEQLTWTLSAHQVAPPVIATPREIVRKFFRR